MFRNILIGVAAVSLAATLSLGWLLKNQYEKTCELEAANAQLVGHIDSLQSANADLNKTIDTLMADKQHLIEQNLQG